jgi:ribosomal protein S18 acetylase RimI-like enzyme
LRTLEAGLAARLAVDRAVAASGAPHAGGTLLRTPGWPSSWDLNRLVLAPGSGDAEVAAALGGLETTTRRITLPLPPGAVAVPDGWDAEELLVMLWPREPLEWPEGVVEVTGRDLHPARSALWSAWVDDAASAEQLAAMQLRFAEQPGGRCVAVRDGERFVAWAQVVEGWIDDVWVDEDRRGQGLGRAVTTAAVAAGGWILSTDVADPRPQGLYRSLGFAEAGRIVQLTRR